MDEYGLNDFLTADNMDKVINYNIDNKIKNAGIDKHIRGTIGSVNGNVVDFYPNGSATAISNVKYNAGVNLYYGDDVYALAINGNMNNLIIDTKVSNSDSLFGISLSNYLTIEDCQDYTDWTNDGTEDATLSNDLIYKKYGIQGVRATWPVDTSETYEIYHERTSSIDLSEYADGTVANTEDDYIGIAIYISDIDMIDTAGIDLIFEDSSTNTQETTILPASLSTGWNSILVLKDDFVDNSGDWSDILITTLSINIDSGYEDEFATIGLIAMLKKVSSDLPQGLDITDSPTFAGLTLSGLTASRVVVTDASKVLTSSAVTSTELGYLSGQDQALTSSSSPTFVGITVSGLTASKIVVTNGSKALTSSSLGESDLTYVIGLDQYLTTTSQVQFRDLTLTSTVNNDICELKMYAYTAGSTASNNRCSMTFVNKATVSNNLIEFLVYNDGTGVAQFGVDTIGYYKSAEYFWDITSVEAMRLTNTKTLLINAATRETSMVGGITLKQGTDPTTNSADQVSLFATSGANCTLGIFTELAVSTSTPSPDASLTVNINGTLYKIALETV